MDESSAEVSQTKGYSPGGGGQLHWRVWESSGEAEAPDLYCLHPAPFSGLAFQNLAPLLARSRRVIAPDYPGYGSSCALNSRPTIADFSDAMVQVAQDLSGEGQFDVLGFHTGCLVAAEWSVSNPGRIRKACLIDVPAFAEDTANSMAESHGAPLVPGKDFSVLQPSWDKVYLVRRETQGEAEAFEIFVDQLKGGVRKDEAFYAAFTYPWSKRFPQIDAETMILASQSGLLDGTRQAARIIPAARLIERLDITRSVLDEAAEKTASEVLQFLGGAS